jgi:hypothetical protein
MGARVPAGRLAHASASWLSRRETPEQTEKRQRAVRSVRWRIDVDGTIVTTMRHAPADAAYFQAAVDSIVRTNRSRASADASERWPSLAQQRADAVTDLARDGGGSTSTEVVLHVRGDGCSLDDGTPIPQRVIERIASESFIRALIHDAEGRPINASGRQRHPTARQKRVVKERDRTCECGSTDLLDYHHDPAFEITHQTVVSELEAKCAICHHREHRTAGN